MRCAVLGCQKNSTKFHAFYFPKCEQTRRKWIQFSRKTSLNWDTAVICEDHFREEDFVNAMQIRLCKKKLLKTGACPSVYTDEEPSTSTCHQNVCKEVLILEESAQICPQNVDNESLILEESAQICPQNVENESSGFQSAQTEDLYVQESTEEAPEVCVASPYVTEDIQGLKQQIDTLHREIKRLRKENFAHVQNINNKLLPQIKDLKELLMKSEYKSSNMEEKLKNIFTSGQIKKIQQGSKRQRWTEEDIAKSIALYSTGAKTYKLLRRRQFPLPCIRTLRIWSQKLDVSPGIIKPVVAVLSAAILIEAQKVCILSFDEMKVKSTRLWIKH